MFSKQNQHKKTVADLKQDQREAERQAEEKRRGKLLKESVYPLLCEVTENVEDAKVFLQTFHMVIDQSFMNRKVKTKVNELGIEESMKDSKEAERYKRLFDLVADEPVSAALDIMSSMGNLITNNERTLMKDKKFAELPIRFITYDNEQ